MKKIIIIIFFISNNYGQEKLFNPFELFIGTKNHTTQTDSFSLEKIGVNWNNASHNYLITDDFDPDVLTIYGDAIEPSFSFGWDWVNSNQGGEPPFYGGVFTYGFYKFWTSDAYFYLDYRDCRFQYSDQSPYNLVIDIFIIYDGNTHSFSFIPSSNSQEEFPIQNGSIINIWDAFDSILEVGDPNQFCFEDYTENNLAVYSPLTKAKLFWAAPPPQDFLPTKYRIWYAWSFDETEPEPGAYYWLADIDDAFLNFTDEAIIDHNTKGELCHVSHYYMQALNGTQSLYTTNKVKNYSTTDWTKSLKITNDNNHPRIVWAPYNVSYDYSDYNYIVYRKVETIPPGRPPAVYQEIFETGYGYPIKLEYTDYDFTMGGSSNIASYYVKATAGSLFVSNASNIVSSNVLYYKRTNELLSEKYSLEQNYPNPFNPSTSISYSIPENAFVTLKIYDILGNEVATLVNEEQSAGTYEVEFNTQQTTNKKLVSSGVYFYQLKSGSFIQSRKMILIK